MQLNLNVIGIDVQWIGSSTEISSSKHNWQNQLIEDSSFSINANIYLTHPSSIKQICHMIADKLALNTSLSVWRILITISDIRICF